MDERPQPKEPAEDPVPGNPATPSKAGRHPARMRSCGRPNRRSSPQRGSSSSPPSTTPNPTAKPRTEQHERPSKGAAPQGNSTIGHPQPDRRSHHVTNG